MEKWPLLTAQICVLMPVRTRDARFEVFQGLELICVLSSDFRSERGVSSYAISLDFFCQLVLFNF